MKKWIVIANYASFIWLICVLGVISIIALATKFVTHDPDFSPGSPENSYLLPMLIFFFVGLAAFLVMLASSITSKLMKGTKLVHKPFLGISPKTASLLVGVLIFGAISFLFGLRQAEIGKYSQEAGAVVTGEEVLDAINQHRTSKGLSAVSLEPRICDNLVQRYLDIVNPDNKYTGHAGFEKWYNEEQLFDYELAEVYVSGIGSASDAVKYWETSPGHRSAIEGNYKLGCAYANQGVAVAILGNKK